VREKGGGKGEPLLGGRWGGKRKNLLKRYLRTAANVWERKKGEKSCYPSMCLTKGEGKKTGQIEENGGVV